MLVALFFFIYVAFQASCFGALIQVDENILNRINKLEAADDLASKRIEYLEKAIVDLEKTVQKKEDRINDLEELVKDNHHTCSSDLTLLNERLRELTIKYQTCSSNLKLLDEQLTEIESNCKTNQMNDVMHIDDQESNQTAKRSQVIKLEQNMTDSLNIRGKARDKIPSFLERKKITRRNVGGTIAFTAILEDPSGRVQHVGLKQVVKYNKIITNVGNSYSIHSGIFTIPTNGIYMFHYTVATGWEKEKILVRLMVDSTPQNAVVATSTQYGQDMQAGNVAILSLKQGQVVWVETFITNDVHIYASHGFSSFSGVLVSEN